MVRNLYRFYLYIVYIALLCFIVAALRGLLSVALAFTPLRGSAGTLPDHTLVVQSISFAVIALVIAGALAALHYWLIRRDVSSDATAGASAIRSFFLNMTEALGIAVAVPLIGFMVIGNLARYPESGVVEYAATALPILALVILLEAERRRTQVTAGAALAFQRLHLYGVQILLLIFVASAWLYQIRPIVDSVFLGGRALAESCSGENYCSHYNLFGLGMSVLWFVAVWLVYGWMLRNDNSSFLRLILHFLQFAAGVSLLLFGCYLGVQVMLWAFVHPAVALKDMFGPGAFYDFMSPITLGIVVMLVYHGWLRAAVRQGVITRGVLFLTECALVAFVAATSFWWGCRDVIASILHIWMHTVQQLELPLLVSAIASIVVGVGYIGLDVYLWRRDIAEPAVAAGPRRGLVFALLGGGILMFAIGGAMALYAWATALFGSPLENGQVIISEGLSTFIVGVLLLGIYLWVALRGRLLSALSKKGESAKPTVPVVPGESATPVALTEATAPSAKSQNVLGNGRIWGQPKPRQRGFAPWTPKPYSISCFCTSAPVATEQPETLETLLDDLLAGKITRDEAVVRIRALEQVSVKETD